MKKINRPVSAALAASAHASSKVRIALTCWALGLQCVFVCGGRGGQVQSDIYNILKPILNDFCFLVPFGRLILSGEYCPAVENRRSQDCLYLSLPLLGGVPRTVPGISQG